MEPAPSALKCPTCATTCSTRSNLIRHQKNQHPETSPAPPQKSVATSEVRCVVESDITAPTRPASCSGLSIREQVSTAVGSLLEGDFTLPAPGLIQQMQAKVPSLTYREAEVALAAAAAAVRRVHAYHQDLSTLKEAGDQTRVGSVLARRLVYLNEGPQWPSFSSVPDPGSVLSSQPVLVEDPSNLVMAWMDSGHRSEALPEVPQIDPLPEEEPLPGCTSQYRHHQHRGLRAAPADPRAPNSSGHLLRPSNHHQSRILQLRLWPRHRANRKK